MVTREVHLTDEIRTQVTLELVYTEGTYKRIVEDALFFLDKSRKHNIAVMEKNRYARMSILLMAFYLESLSNLLFDALASSFSDDLDRRTDIPKPIRRFMAVHYQLYQAELPLSTDGIRDIFTIRNRVIAHPTGFSKERHSEVAPGCWERSRVDKNVSYGKFTNLPFTYSQFTSSHAEKILGEVRGFLTSFHSLLKGKVSEQKVLDACWPTELIEWSKK